MSFIFPQCLDRNNNYPYHHYLLENVISTYKIDKGKVKEYYETLAHNQLASQIIKVVGIAARLNGDTYVEFVTTKSLPGLGGVYYSHYNRIKVREDAADNQSTLLHEHVHQAMHVLFGSVLPWKNDIQSALHLEAVSKTLKDLIIFFKIDFDPGTKDNYAIAQKIIEHLYLDCSVILPEHVRDSIHTDVTINDQEKPQNPIVIPARLFVDDLLKNNLPNDIPTLTAQPNSLLNNILNKDNINNLLNGIGERAPHETYTDNYQYVLTTSSQPTATDNSVAPYGQDDSEQVNYSNLFVSNFHPYQKFVCLFEAYKLLDVDPEFIPNFYQWAVSLGDSVKETFPHLYKYNEDVILPAIEEYELRNTDTCPNPANTIFWF